MRQIEGARRDRQPASLQYIGIALRESCSDLSSHVGLPPQVENLSFGELPDQIRSMGAHQKQPSLIHKLTEARCGGALVLKVGIAVRFYFDDLIDNSVDVHPLV